MTSGKTRILASVLALTAGVYALPANAESTLARDMPPYDSTWEENAYRYEWREPCQSYYWGVERLGIETSCTDPEEETLVVEERHYMDMDVFKSYTVYFDFDKSNIRASERDTLDSVARDIVSLEPLHVTVVGHADASGPADYNQALSARRADTVSDALTAMGVPNTVIDENAMGEQDLAVPTPDGVRLQENRRVTIQFRR